MKTSLLTLFKAKWIQIIYHVYAYNFWSINYFINGFSTFKKKTLWMDAVLKILCIVIKCAEAILLSTVANTCSYNSSPC